MLLDILKNDKTKDLLKYFIHTSVDILYNDVFFYICIICIYSISSFIILLAILYFCLFSMRREPYDHTPHIYVADMKWV